MARLVIVIGIPFGYLGDCRNKCKMEYLDKLSQSNATEERYRLTGKKWYEMKAMRAVCQAIGRVIRHKDDFGAILLLDERMAQRERIQQISPWLRDQIRVEEELKAIFKPLRDFFKDRAGQAFPNTPLENQVIQENLQVLEPLSDTKAELNRQPEDSRNLRGNSVFLVRKRAKTEVHKSHSTTAFNGMLYNLMRASDEENEEAEENSPTRPLNDQAQNMMHIEPAKPSLQPAHPATRNSGFRTGMPPFKQQARPADDLLSLGPDQPSLPGKRTPQAAESPVRDLGVLVDPNHAQVGETQAKHAAIVKCPICIESNKQQVYFSYLCGHNACEDCIIKYLISEKTKSKKPASGLASAKSVRDLKKSEKLRCPTCKEECKASDLRRNFLE